MCIEKRLLILFISIIGLFSTAQQTASDKLTEGYRYPFSYRGSYWTISRWTGFTKEPKAAYLHDVSRTGSMELLRFDLLCKGEIQPLNYQQTPYHYSLTSETGTVQICYETETVMRFKGNGTNFSLRYEKAVEVLPINDRQFRLMLGNHRMVFTLLKGTFKMQRKDLGIRKAFHNPLIPKKNLRILVAPDADGDFEFALERYVSEYVPRTSHTPFEELLEIREQEYIQWLVPFKGTEAELNPSFYDALALSWSSLIQPKGHHKLEAMMISKTWMNGIWSWDHCFNALAMARYQPAVAWNNLVCLFDSQDNLGALPDAIFVNDLRWGHLKQPMHGWTLLKMMEQHPSFLETAKLEVFYPKLEKWTHFWTKYRDDDKNGLVQINHGNDNFDHLPIYDIGFPVEDPHVNMMLIFQMEALSKIAEKLGKKDAAKDWEEKSKKMVQTLIARCWDGERFLYKKSGTEIHRQKAESVLHYTPMMLGERLPKDIRKTLVANFKTSALTTDFGIVTESIKSPFFDENTYTRGCIWPPLNLFIIEGLLACEEDELAKELAKRYVKTVEKNGFAERFAAFTGAPLSDPSYTWTSSVYLILKERFKI